jgi:Tfp pilus assembly protein PilV
MRFTQKQKQRAFTLLETTMAMYITLMGVLTFAAMAVFANKVGMQAKIRTGAYQIANQQLEVLRTTSFDNLATATQQAFTVPTEFTSSLPGANNSKYQVAGTYTIESLTSTTKKIAVRIQWRNAAANQGVVAPWSEVRLVTQIARPGSVGSVLPVTTTTTPTVSVPVPPTKGKAATSSSGGVLGAKSLSDPTTSTDPTDPGNSGAKNK